MVLVGLGRIGWLVNCIRGCFEDEQKAALDQEGTNMAMWSQGGRWGRDVEVKVKVACEARGVQSRHKVEQSESVVWLGL